MKICYLADAESIHTKRWCAHFHALGHEIHLISFKNVSLDFVHVHFVDAGKISVEGGNKKVLWKVPAIRKLLREIKPDILHAHYATSYGIVGAMCGYHPYVITALGSDVLVSPKNSFAYRLLLKYAFRRADWNTAMAEHMRKEMIRLGSPEERTSVVSFGVDLKIFNPEGRSTNSDQFTITSTRNFEPIYNIPDLISAVAAIKDNIAGLKLNLIGDGTLRASLEQQVKDAGLADVTTFYGRIPQPQIADVLRQTDLFVTLSSSDGNNISLNEAMACGAYCIATDIPANTAWITDDVNGILVPVNSPKVLSEKIFYVCNNMPKLRDETQPINWEIVQEKANWEANMRGVELKYQQLCKR